MSALRQTAGKSLEGDIARGDQAAQRVGLTPGQRADARPQLVHLEGFDEIIIRPRIKPAHPVMGFGACCQQQHRPQ